MLTPTTVTLHADKQCKGSVRYATNDPKAPVDNIYVSRDAADKMPDTVKVTIESA